MRDKYGNYVVQKAIEKANETQRTNLLKKIQAVASIVRRQANYSRHVFTFLEKLQKDGLIKDVGLESPPMQQPKKPQMHHPMGGMAVIQGGPPVNMFGAPA